MAEKNVISVIATVASKLPDLAIKDAQIIFVKDRKKIALDQNGKRTFYNEIETFDTDQERSDLLTPINGCFYFVISTAVLWFYNDGWIQITNTPQEVLFIGTEFPELGSENKIYVNKEKKNIMVWDDEQKSYILVGENVKSISNTDIDKLF